MPRLRHDAPAQRTSPRRHREAYRAATEVEPAQKMRRLVQIGPSPPPFTTASRLLATRGPRNRHEQPEPPHATSADGSPKVTTKRRIVLVKRNKPLELRPSASPPHAAPITTAPPLSDAQGVDTRQTPRLQLLQRQPQLEWSATSSPIGTFAGQAAGRSGRGLCLSHTGAPEQAARDRSTHTVGLPSLHHPARIRVGHRGRQSTAQTSRTGGVTRNENAGASLEPLAKAKRRRARIQRVQLGGGLPPSSSTDQPLSDADHQRNSQPDADALGAAYVSEISLFPTLPHARQQGVAVSSILPAGPMVSATDTSHDSLFKAPGPPVVASERMDEQPEDGDWSAGLLQVLSQSALRKLGEVRPVEAVSSPPSPREQQEQSDGADTGVHSPSRIEAQHQVQVDFDTTHFTRIQAQRMAASIINSKDGPKRWSSVHPDSDTSSKGSFVKMRSPGPRRLLQAAVKPPSMRDICRDIGFSSSQLQKRPSTDLPHFAHHQRLAGYGDNSQSDDGALLGAFEHGLCFAGYRLARQTQPRAHSQSTELPSLHAFNEAALQRRRHTQRKEVVKVIVPFSEPSLSAHATRACFIAPTRAPRSAGHRPHSRSADGGAVLVWMQSTAHSFFRALDGVVQAGSAPVAQNSSSSHGADSLESSLYPSPILHYAAHTQQGGAPSHVALYVHLDRLEHVRDELAAMELGNGNGNGGDDSYRPFSDPDVHLLVTSVQGEPLCLI
ncbi:hypothetical protein EX895_005282 [Sporisorium graminicola]|uniref:Uncharacterized protein n=1 Tax=Sporisorium graminicola TaxID=280036 RepID=A0A4U7KRY4_9BASI|nr:hypothetical protein EX895_005282 [Sporisorium graminicola]TKY85742.1 hypothetical protein EX895_005282 [Sporisorium graminicola]